MADPIAIGGIADALELGPHELVSLVGGGGKTTVLFELGRQLAGTVVLTTTTKMLKVRTSDNPVLIAPHDDELADALISSRTVLAWQSVTADKALGVDRESCDRWFDLADHVIVEADGARRRPFKAPSPFEPVVPSRTTMLIACVGGNALGRVIADQCHRPMRVAALAGCSPYQRLTPERLASVLLSDRGLRKGRPAVARYAIVANGVGEPEGSFIEELVDVVNGRAPIISVAPNGDLDGSARRAAGT